MMKSIETDVRYRRRELDVRVGGEDPHALYSRIIACTRRPFTPTYSEAVNLAALATLLAASIERSEHARIDTGDAA